MNITGDINGLTWDLLLSIFLDKPNIFRKNLLHFQNEIDTVQFMLKEPVIK